MLRIICFILLSSFLAVYGQNMQKEIQTQLIMAESGETITIPEGKFTFDGTLSLDDKENIIIKGAGMDKTFLSFKGQSQGAEGIRVSNCKKIVIEDLTVQDAKGDAIKTMDVQGIVFRNVRTEWTGKPNKNNGAYGLYPVSCEDVLIDGCEAIGASDAGIYVGQSHNIIVRNSTAFHNVAGIEIENSTMADVYDCKAYNNTGGILIFDLPDLPKEKGGNIRVYNNEVRENNYKNFAPKGNIVASVPPGTGIMILATNNVEVYGNHVLNNKTASMAIISYYMAQVEIKDENYYPYPTAIYVHDNNFDRKKMKPTWSKQLGFLLWWKFKKKVPNILYDGIVDPETLAEDGSVKEAYQICIRDNQGETFANLDAEGGFKNIVRELDAYNCERKSLASPTLGR